MKAAFGEYIKKLRQERRLTLRAFCEAVGMDPGNYSKQERGLLLPPQDEEKLAVYERALGLEADSEQARELRRRAALGRGEVPAAVLNNQEIAGKLPALFRTLEGDSLDEAVLDELIKTIRKA
jgi:transcriptional regulator with XRE-family HTH domain